MQEGVEHVEFHVEEQSMEALLRTILPRIFEGLSFDVFTYQGKLDLLRELPKRLKGQIEWLPATYRIIVVIDADDDDCEVLRSQLDEIATHASSPFARERSSGRSQVASRSRSSRPGTSVTGTRCARRTGAFRTSPRSSRIAVRTRSRVGPGRHSSACSRAPGISRAVSRRSQLRAVAAHMDPTRNRSPSFSKLWEVLQEVAG